MSLVTDHPTVQKFLRFFNANYKREKVFRLLAYLSRFLAYYAQRKGFSAETVQMFSGLKGHFAMIRKGMRFWKPLNHLDLAVKASLNKVMDPVLQYTTVWRNLFYAGFFAFDSIVWFKMLGVVSKTSFPTAGKRASQLWALGLVAGLLNGLRGLQVNCAKLSAAEEKDDVDQLKEKLYQTKRKLVWDALDFFIALNLIGKLHFTEGDVGLAGIITSIMGLKDLWATT